MMNFKISADLDSAKVFLMELSKLEKRLDPSTYHIDRLSAIQTLKSCGLPLKKLKFLVSPSTANVKEISSNETVYVGLENVESNTGEYIYTSEKESISSALTFQKGDILFPKLRPYLNKVFYAPFDGICSTEFHVFKSKLLNNEYLSHFLRSDLVVRQTQKLMSGNTLPRVQTEDIYNLLVPVVSPSQQKKIVHLMALAKSERKIKLAEAKFHLETIDSYLLNELGIKLPVKEDNILRTFTTSYQNLSGKRFDPKLFEPHSQNLFAAIKNAKYTQIKLKELLVHSMAGDWGLDDNYPVEEEDFTKCLVIRATEFDNLYNLKLENERVRFRLIQNEKLKKLDLQPNDLLIEKSGGSPDQPVGRIALLTKDLVDANTLCYSNFIHKIRIDETKVSPEYLFCYLKTIHNIKITEIMQSQTNGIRNLIMGEYLGQLIVLPPLEKQKEIGTEASRRRYEAQRLEQEANLILEKAKKEVEYIFLKSE